MKRAFRLFLLTIAMVLCSGLTFAQHANNRQRLTREQLAEAQAEKIAKQLAFDDETTGKFITTFCNCQKEIWALGPRKRKPQAKMTDAETEQALKEKFANSQKLLNIREKYYQEYSKFLTQLQIQRVYELEKQMMKRLASHGKKRAANSNRKKDKSK